MTRLTERDLQFIEDVASTEKWSREDLVIRLVAELRDWRAGRLYLRTTAEKDAEARASQAESSALSARRSAAFHRSSGGW